MSPFQLLALVGPGVALHVSETMHDAFPDRYAVSDNMRRMVEAGITSVWIPGDGGTPILDPRVNEVLVQGDSPSDEEQLVQRISLALADEARRMLDEGVVAEAQDIDLCMILGAGWPFWLGGLTPYLDRTGAAEMSGGRRFLPRGVASLPG
jgi:3-hydroxyacyl-CoA dehydrogenase